MKSQDITDIICNDNDFKNWLQSMTDEITYTKLLKTIDHLCGNDLIVKLETNKTSTSFMILISGKDDDDGISFDFYRLKEGQWRFGINIEDELVQNETLDLSGKGYARLMMIIMIYCLEKHIELPIDIKLPGIMLTIGICADSSEGFWGHMGMKMGKYSMDKDRYSSMTGPNVGYDKEFLLRDWKKWVFLGEKAFLKKRKRKKSKRKKRKKPKGSKRRRSSTASSTTASSSRHHLYHKRRKKSY